MDFERNRNGYLRFKKGLNGHRIHRAVAQASGNTQAGMDVINAANHGAGGSQGDAVTALKSALSGESNTSFCRSLSTS